MHILFLLYSSEFLVVQQTDKDVVSLTSDGDVAVVYEAMGTKPPRNVAVDRQLGIAFWTQNSEAFVYKEPYPTCNTSASCPPTSPDPFMTLSDLGGHITLDPDQKLLFTIVKFQGLVKIDYNANIQVVVGTGAEVIVNGTNVTLTFEELFWGTVCVDKQQQ